MINTSEFWKREVLEIEERSKDRNNIDIVFYGSSSIRMWSTLSNDFENYKVLNHGFGGSKIKDAIYYYDRLVKPYVPRLVVTYTGSNDIQPKYRFTRPGRRVYRRFKKLFKKHMETIGSPMIYILVTPSVNRFSCINQIKLANKLIKNFALKHEQLYVLDVTNEFLIDGKPNEELFVGDGLHMNQDGYQIWIDAIKPMVDDLLG